MPLEPHESRLSTEDLVQILFRHKKKLVLFPLCTLLVGMLVILFYPRTYRSEAKLFLQVGRESVGLDPTATTGQTISLQQAGREDEIKSAIDVLRSRGVISQAVDQVGPDVVLGRAGVGRGSSNAISAAVSSVVSGFVATIKSIDPVSEREEAVIRVEEELQVDAERDSTVIVIRLDAKTPQLAQAVCDAIVRVYQEEHMRIHRNAESSEFFEQQHELLRTQLDEAIEQVRQAKSEFGLADIEDRRDTLESQRSAIELASYKAEQELATAEARVSDLQRQLDQVPERMISAQTRVPNQGADLLREQLYALQVKSMDLKARYRDAHPLVAAIEEQIREAEKVMQSQQEERTETTDDINPVHQKLSLELKQQLNVVAGLQARLNRLSEQGETLLADLRAVNVHEVKLDQLERAVQIARTKFYQYADSLEQARIDQVLARQSISNVSIAQPATLAEKPVSPSKVMVGLATLAIAVGGTSSLIMASERLNDKLRTAEEVEALLQVPVFATIPSDSAPSRVLVN